MPLVSIILVNYNSAAIIKDCLQSLRQFNQTIPSEVIVVDNASQDRSPEIIAEYFPEVILLREVINHGFGKGNNIGAGVAQGEFILFLNPDTIATCDFLPSLLEVMEQDSQVGIVAPQLVNRDGTLQISTSPAISVQGEYLAQKRSHQYRRGKNLKKITQALAHQQEVDIVVGAALLIRRRLFDQLRGFDENFFMYFEESDLCQRSQYLGWRIIYYPHVSLIHLHGESTKKIPDRMVLEYRRSQIYYYQKHRPLWEQKFLQVYLLIKFGLLWFLSLLASPQKQPNQQSVITVNQKIILMALNSRSSS
jgi:GT2 family glycosyltransferase